MRIIRLFHNEIFKMKHSRQIKMVSFCVLLFSAFVSVNLKYERNLMDITEYGYGAAFEYFRQIAVMLIIFLAPMAADMTAREVDQGTIQNALSRGVRRGEYFAVKLICFLGYVTLSTLLGFLVYLVFRTMLLGFNPQGLVYPDYLLSVCTYIAGSLVLLYTYGLLVFCLGYYFDSVAAASFTGIVMLVLDAVVIFRFTPWPSPVRAADTMYEVLLKEQRILTMDFVWLLIPFICVCIIFGLLSWVFFRRKDI